MVLNTSEINQNLSEIKKGNQKQISDYPGLLDKIKDRVSKYIPRLKTAFCKKYEGDKITETEKIAFEFYPDYKGDIRHLFLFYDWRKVDDFENPKLAQVCELNPNCIPDFHEVYGFYPEILSVDKGMDSEKNNKFCKDKGIGAYIQALERIANRRSECEREFSRDKWGYRRDRMPNRGDKEAELFMLITIITTLLTAITAFYVGRADLIRSTSASAFKRLH